MKNIFKSLLTLLLAAFSFTAFAQTNSIAAVQGGTAHLKNGTCSVTLNEPMAADAYFVAVTPLGASKGLYVTKSGNAFTVKVNGKAETQGDIDFDYVVYRKLPVRQANTTFKPKMAPGAEPAK